MKDQENKSVCPIDSILLQVAIGNILNDIVYYQLNDISKTRPLTEEGQKALEELREIVTFEKVDKDIQVLASIQDQLYAFNNGD